jgi:peptidoglycan/xylan/chitin deacetylase (PgdA/CDA1 family)
MPHFSRRAVLRGGVVAAGGAAGTLLGEAAWGWTRPVRLPVNRGYTGMEDNSRLINRGQVMSTFFVRTSQKSVALTFDDGPGPNWTPMVLDQLDEVQASATFFMVGEHLRANAHLVADRMERHEIGNHTWTHADLAEMDVDGALAQLTRTADEIRSVFGRDPTVMRPPWARLTGSTVAAVSKLNYDIVVWNRAVSPSVYPNDTAGQVAALVETARPGDIILAHDVGPTQRLAGLKGIADIVRGLRERGIEPVTVSRLLGMAEPAPSG